MRLELIAHTSADVASTSARSKKTERLAATLAELRPDEVRVGVSYLSGELPQGSIGVGWAALRELPPPTAGSPTLELLEIDAAASRIAGLTGKGSQAARADELARVFGRATESEQRFLT